MKYIFVLVFIFMIFMSGCSVAIKQVETDNVFISEDNKSFYTDKLVKVAVNSIEIDYAPSTKHQNIITIDLSFFNDSTTDIFLNMDELYIVDNLNRKYNIENIDSLYINQSNYLIPYPYVGYYYLEDSVEYENKNSNFTNDVFYSNVDFSDMKRKQFDFGKISPKMNKSGLLLFSIDPYSVNEFDFFVNYIDSTGKRSTARFKYRMVK